ncbi:U-box domain-containing protein 44-like [Silene latifolia]|uniref:U-box domain-containing protein 44-like n=1 Tax=Silene latifolia TaxID=37657 RepID=UPI003D76B122
MAGSSGGSSDRDSQADESKQLERRHIEPVFSTFVCPLTKEVMQDPVIIENGNTFERSAIKKWFEQCKKSGRKPVCPLTLKELRNTQLNPSIALIKTIKEWEARNEAAQLDVARRSLSSAYHSETDILQALNYIKSISKGSGSNKHDVHEPEIVRLVVKMLRNSSITVRSTALKTLCVVAEQESDLKEVMTEGATIRTIVKFLSPERSTEREKEEAISLLYELSKSPNLCEKIGSEQGAILILVSISGSESENVRNVEKADKTLDNLAQSENNVRQMAESGSLEPLLMLILKGTPETKKSMAAFLGNLVLNNDVKVAVAKTVGPSLVSLMTNTDIETREASLKALNQISSYDASAKVLIQAGILPPLLKDLFSVGEKQFPMRLKEVSATILSNLVNSGYDIGSVIISPKKETLVSVDTIRNLLHLISNTGPSIESKLLQVLVGLTSYPKTVSSVVAAIKSSGATIIGLVEYIDEQDLRLAVLKLLLNLSPYMAQELADALIASGQLGCLLNIIMENSGITEEQAATVSLLAELPESDVVLTREMLKKGSFGDMISRVKEINQGEIRGGRFMTPYLDGLVRSLARITYVLANEPEAVDFCRVQNLTGQFVELLQVNGSDNVKIASAWALEKLFSETSKLTANPPTGMCASIFTCFGRLPDRTTLCRLHGGLCSLKETFCLADRRTQAVEKLVALLDHENDKVVEASLAALLTLVDDGVHIEEGVMILHETNGTKPIVEILVEKRSENLRKRAVWAVERFLRTDRIATEIPNEQNIVSALVDAFHNGDNRTRQIAERALRHVDRLPNFSEVFQTP